MDTGLDAPSSLKETSPGSHSCTPWKDQDMKVQRLLFLVLLLRCPGSPNPNLVHVVPGRFPLGPDGVGVLWKLPIITAPLGVCVLLIYIWRTILAAQDASEDGEQRAFRAKKRELQEYQRWMEDHCNALSSLKTTQEAELKLLRRKVGIVVDFSEQRRVAAEEKVAKTRRDLEATESQLSAAVENLKGIKEETDKYKREVGALQDQLREAELTFKHKIAAHERSALDNWTKARVWERKIVQQSRENAYVRHRLHMMRRGTLPEGSMRQEPMPGRPETQNRVRRGLWSDAETGGSPMGNRGTEPPRDPGMSKVGTDVRGFPHAPRPPHMPYHMGQGLPGFTGYGPPPPPPHGWTWGPQAQLVPATHGLRPYSETCGTQGDNSGTPPKKVPQKDQNPVDARGPPPVPGPLGPPYPTDPPSSPSWGPGAHLPPPTQWSLRPYPAPEPTAQGGMI
ncbi:uncharacterized protein LOC118555505 isoform X1 [Halichoerus grypus]